MRYVVGHVRSFAPSLHFTSGTPQAQPASCTSPTTCRMPLSQPRSVIIAKQPLGLPLLLPGALTLC